MTYAPFAAAAMATLLAGAPALAAAAPLSDVSAEITNLRYRLVDLDPEDGLTPSITFNQAVRTGLRVNEGSGLAQDQQLSIPIFSDATGELTTPSGLAESARVADNGFKTHAQILLSDEATFELIDTIYGITPGVKRSADLFSVFQPGESNLAWALSPRSALIIEGSARSRAVNDFAPLVNGGFVSGPQAKYHGLRGDSIATAGVNLFTTQFSYQTSTFFQSVRAGLNLTPAGLENVFPDDPTNAAESFMVRMDNTHGEDLRGYLFVDTGVRASLTAMPGPVPEPETWALALGGLGLVLLRRRQRT